jgi:1,2-dihydroxy-3-keto-5-methylthiopentene dioxygenase
MAILQLEDGTTYNQLVDIVQALLPLGIQLNYWAVKPQIQPLLAKSTLNEDEKEEVLTALDEYFESLQQSANYQSRDLIALHPEVPNLDTLLSKFDKIHTHADDEVRYIIDGEGVFGFVMPDATQIRLTVQAEEYINVPAGIEHWFYLTQKKRIKAVRYFTDTAGWVPQYTGQEIRFPIIA